MYGIEIGIGEFELWGFVEDVGVVGAGRGGGGGDGGVEKEEVSCGGEG